MTMSSIFANPRHHTSGPISLDDMKSGMIQIIKVAGHRVVLAGQGNTGTSFAGHIHVYVHRRDNTPGESQIFDTSKSADSALSDAKTYRDSLLAKYRYRASK
jgi:hypothetical protein